MERVNLSRAGSSLKLSERSRRRAAREITETPGTTLRELQASAGDMRETDSSSELYGRVTK